MENEKHMINVMADDFMEIKELLAKARMVNNLAVAFYLEKEAKADHIELAYFEMIKGKLSLVLEMIGEYAYEAEQIAEKYCAAAICEVSE